MASSDPDLGKATAEFVKGGWVVSVLGLLGALARMIFSNKSYPALRWIMMGIAGAITGVICFFALYGSSIDPLYKSIIYSCSGAFSSEMLNRLRLLLPPKTKRSRK